MATMFHVEQRRITLAGLIFCLIVIPIIYMLARNRQLNHGPVPPEKEWWAEQARLAKEYDRIHGHTHHRYRRY